jgi:hypothetical protein
MSRILKSRRAKVLVGVMATMAVAAVAAFAYFTATGTGTGTGSATVSTSAVMLTGTLDSNLTKIGDTKQMTITASNPGTSPEHVTSISVGAITLPDLCPTGSFSFDTPSVTGTEVAAATDATHPGIATVGHVNVTFVDQDAAQNTCTSVSAVLNSL